MPASRTTFNSGPGKIAWNSIEIYSMDDIVGSEGFATEDVATSWHGKVDERVHERPVEISFTPAEVENLTTFFGILSSGIGDVLFPQTDLPLIMWGKDQTKRTYSAAAITKLPDLNLGAKLHPFGPMSFTCLGTGDAAWSVTNNLITQATGQSVPANSLTVANLLRQAYTGAWGAKSAPWAAIKSVDGWQIKFNLALTPKSTDDLGIQNYFISGFSVECSVKPVGVVEGDLAAVCLLDGTGAGRGMSLAAQGANLVLAAGTTPRILTVTIKGASLKSYKLNWSDKANPRITDLTWIATNSVLGGTLADYFSIALT